MMKESKSGLLIQASNIHMGGGSVLLDLLLNELTFDSYVFLDSRKSIEKGDYSFEQVKPNLISRFRTEFTIRKMSRCNGNNLIFTNLPPLFKLKGKTTLFIQNAILLYFSLDPGYGLKTKLRHLFERVWLRLFISNVDEIVVQNNSMRASVINLFGEKIKVTVLPFYSIDKYKRSNLEYDNVIEKRDAKFLYVASGDAHKNHRALIKAWIDLAGRNVNAPLYLTVDKQKEPDLFLFIEKSKKEFDLNIINLGLITHDEVLELYDICQCLLYPSLKESFGIPLLEARNANLDIIASELDFVRDLIDPEQSFNPNSSISIARAVCRYLNVEYSVSKLLSAKGFIEEISKQ